MEGEKDYLKSPSHDNSEPESTFTILPSGVNTDINLGSLGDISDNMAVTVDSSGLDHHMKGEGGYSSSQQALIPENFVLVETSKGLILSVADGSSDGINFNGTCIATVADDHGRPIISSSLSGGIFTQIQQVGVIDDQQNGVYDSVSSSNTVSSTTIPVYVDPDSTMKLTESVQYVRAEDEGSIPSKKKKGGGWPKGKKRKPVPDVQAPRKPTTGYVIYALKRRKEIKEEKPNLIFSEVTKVLGQEWSNLSQEEKDDYMKLAEEDKQRYITEMEQFQNSDVYQSFLKNKKTSGSAGMLKGFTEGSNPLIDLEESLGMNDLYCKVCNQYFISSHNKKEHMFGRSHLQNIKNEIQKDIQQQTQLASSLETSQETNSYNLSNVHNVADPSKSNSPSIDINDFVQEFLQKNIERDVEIKRLRKVTNQYQNENLEIAKQMKEVEEYETKLEQDLGNLKAYGASLSAQIDALKMVPTLFGVINF